MSYGPLSELSIAESTDGDVYNRVCSVSPHISKCNDPNELCP